MDDIKWAVFKNGGVSTSLYVEVNSSNLSKSDYYNEKTDSYYYNGSKAPNHDVVIIGWDDNYSKSNFAEKVPGDGAYICQNRRGLPRIRAQKTPSLRKPLKSPPPGVSQRSVPPSH